MLVVLPDKSWHRTGRTLTAHDLHPPGTPPEYTISSDQLLRRCFSWGITTSEAVEAFILHCRSRNLSPKTIGAYEWALDKLQEAHQLLPLSSDPLTRFLADQDLDSDESHFDLWRWLRTFYTWFSARTQTPNPMAEIAKPLRRKKLPRTLEPHEVERLLAGIEAPREYALVVAILDTGVRNEELASIIKAHIYRHTLKVIGKGGERTVPVSRDVRRMLLDLGDARHVWIGRKGPLTPSGVNQAIQRVLRRAGIFPPKAGPHLLRHTFGRLYVMNGGDLESLRQIMGHADISTTQIYAELNDHQARRQHAKYSPMQHLSVRRR